MIKNTYNCDHEDCDEEITVLTNSSTRGYREIQIDGWQSWQGPLMEDIHLCPTHKVKLNAGLLERMSAVYAQWKEDIEAEEDY